MSENQVSLNIKSLDDIKNYIESHKNDFKQIFFKPDTNNINSSLVGVFNKDIYGTSQVSAHHKVPGFHTPESCKLNTAIYANSQIDYNSPKNYVSGAKVIRVNGDFANSPNYFLAPSQNPSQKVSIEITGYISATNTNSYGVQQSVFPTSTEYALVWIGNNALKTYRKENAVYVYNKSVQKNVKTRMGIGEYTPFRIQYSCNIEETPLDYRKIFIGDDGTIIDTVATNANENNLYYYSLTPSEKLGLYDCNIYKGSELQKYRSESKQQVLLVWSKIIPEETAFIALNMAGDLIAFNSQNEKILNIFNFANTPRESVLVLDDVGPNIIITKRATKSKLYVSASDISIKMSELITNDEWVKESANGFVGQISNKETQITPTKKMSAQQINETKSLYSASHKLKLCIMKDRNNKKILALLASKTDPEVFYTAEPDLRMNKLFYASTYPENKYLREVPPDLQEPANTYSTYSGNYPYSASSYSVSDYSDTNTCETQCNSTLGCNYFYKVTDSTGKQECLLSNNKELPTFLPKQNDKYVDSTLAIRNKIIKTGDEKKDAEYSKASYVPNGYDNVTYSDYVEKNVLDKSFTPGPEGTSYIVDLKNNVSKSTVGTTPFSTTNINSAMNAGKIENFTQLGIENTQQAPFWSVINSQRFTTIEGLTVVEDTLTKLNQVDTKLTDYGSKQASIEKNRLDISNNIYSINRTYLDMSNNPATYDFTGDTIYSLNEDRTMTKALAKDNAIYNEEQNTVYVITTLTVATLLLTAILI